MKSLTTTLQSILSSLLNKYIFCIYFRLVEVFSWLLEVANDTKENWDGGKIIWSVSYVFDAPKLKDSSPETTGSTPEETRKKIIAKLEINKDDIQAVLPIAKVTNREKLLHEQEAKIFRGKLCKKLENIRTQRSYVLPRKRLRKQF